MQLIEITTVPIEYKLRIRNAELRLAEAEKDKIDAYKDAYKAKEKNVSENGANMAVVKPGYVPKSDKTDLPENKTGNEMDAGTEDIALKLAGEYDAEINETTSVPKATAPDFTVKINSEFQNRLPVNQYIEFSNKIYGKSEKSESQLDIMTNDINKYQKVKEQYQKNSKELEYIRGEVKMEILTKPRVDINYIGGFMYVPPSSDPDYEEPFYEKIA